jgi:hypothetical protein
MAPSTLLFSLDPDLKLTELKLENLWKLYKQEAWQYTSMK